LLFYENDTRVTDSWRQPQIGVVNWGDGVNGVNSSFLNVGWWWFGEGSGGSVPPFFANIPENHGVLKLGQIGWEFCLTSNTYLPLNAPLPTSSEIGFIASDYAGC